MKTADFASALAIDGGGTRCRFLLLRDEVRHAADGGSANVSTDFEDAVTVLRTGISLLSEMSGVAVDDIAACPAFVGIAGMTGPDMARRLTNALPFANAVYADDRPAALRGALGARDGAIAHCGTGSFLASQIDGHVRLAGGWGSVLGDEASAHWVGRRMLSLTLQCVDGFQPISPLTEAVLARFDDAAGIVAFAGSASPAEIGALAPLVTVGAESGDPIAKRVLQEAATDLANGLTNVGWQAGLAICLTGGIGPHFASLLPEQMQADLRPPEAAPIEGALALALDHAERVAG